MTKIFLDINAARCAHAGKVIVWHQHQLGGQLRDRWLWTGEKNGEVIDYHRKAHLIAEALAVGEQVIVLRLHRNGTVTATPVRRTDTKRGRVIRQQ